MESWGTWLAVGVGAVIIAIVIRRWGSRLGLGFQIGFLIRCQLLLLFSPLIIISLSFFVKSVFANLVIVDRWREAFLVSGITFGSSWLCLAMIVQVLDHAEERFAVKLHVPTWFWEWSAIVFALPPFALMVRVYLSSYTSSSGPVLPGLVLGCVAALFCAVVIDSAVHFLDPPQTTPMARRFIFASTSYPGAIGRFLNNSDPLRSVPLWLFRWLSRLGPGYLAPNGKPYADLIAMAASVLATLVLYTVSFYVGWRLLAHGHGSTGVPALAYLEFLILSIAIVVAGAAFFLDRYRAPALASVLIYSLAVSMLADTDHYWFATIPKRGLPSQAYSDGVQQWLKKYKNETGTKVLRFNNKPVVVVVCASGGGIEAAAWTVKVLKGLYTDLGPDYGPAFIRSIRLISSTSGGSVGSLFFVQSFFTAGDVPSDTQFDNIWTAATTRSLDASGWGFAHPDFARLFAPWALRFWLGGDQQARKIDRGWALEQSWRVALKDPQNKRKYVDSNLSDWRDSVASGVLPGTVFNATVVETGDPLLLSTVHLVLPPDSRSHIFGQTRDDWGADISNVTAARLSATFPYVSPVARGRYTNDTRDCCQPVEQMHIADGGYYDNFGVTVAVEWIKQITEKYKDCLGKIVVVRIDAFPEDSEKKTPEERSQFAHLMNPRTGWGSEVLGPLKAMLNARSETQYGRDVIEFDLLKNDGGTPISAESENASPPPSSSQSQCDGFVNIVPFVAAHSGPLSWQLSAQDKSDIDQDWSRDTIKQQIAILRTCLAIH